MLQRLASACCLCTKREPPEQPPLDHAAEHVLLLAFQPAGQPAKWSTMGKAAEMQLNERPRVVACLVPVSERAPGKDEVVIPAHQNTAAPWLSLQLVSVHAAGYAAWGDSGLAKQWLQGLSARSSAFLQTLSEVALSVVGTQQDVAWLPAPTTVTYQPSEPQAVHTLPSGCCLRVSSSFIRDARSGMLRPALLLDLEPCSDAAFPLVQLPLAQSPTAVSGPLFGGDASSTCPAPASQQANGAASQGASAAAEPAAQSTNTVHGSGTSTEMAASSRPDPPPPVGSRAASAVAGCSSTALLQGSPRAMGLNSPARPVPMSPVPGQWQGPLPSKHDEHDRRQERKQQRGQLRAQAALSTIPCIATLVQLSWVCQAPDSSEININDSTEAEHDSRTGWLPVTGRVLMQNERSVAYWGKLTKRAKDGSAELLSALFRTEPDALTDLRQNLSQLFMEQPGNLLGGPKWEKVVHVPASQRWLSQHLRQHVQRCSDGSAKGDLAALLTASPDSLHPPVLPAQHSMPLGAREAAMEAGPISPAHSSIGAHMHTPFWSMRGSHGPSGLSPWTSQGPPGTPRTTSGHVHCMLSSVADTSGSGLFSEEMKRLIRKDSSRRIAMPPLVSEAHQATQPTAQTGQPQSSSTQSQPLALQQPTLTEQQEQQEQRWRRQGQREGMEQSPSASKELLNLAMAGGSRRKLQPGPPLSSIDEGGALKGRQSRQEATRNNHSLLLVGPAASSVGDSDSSSRNLVSGLLPSPMDTGGLEGVRAHMGGEIAEDVQASQSWVPAIGNTGTAEHPPPNTRQQHGASLPLHVWTESHTHSLQGTHQVEGADHGQTDRADAWRNRSEAGSTATGGQAASQSHRPGPRNRRGAGRSTSAYPLSPSRAVQKHLSAPYRRAQTSEAGISSHASFSAAAPSQEGRTSRASSMRTVGRSASLLSPVGSAAGIMSTPTMATMTQGTHFNYSPGTRTAAATAQPVASINPSPRRTNSHISGMVSGASLSRRLLSLDAEGSPIHTTAPPAGLSSPSVSTRALKLSLLTDPAVWQASTASHASGPHHAPAAQPTAEVWNPALSAAPPESPSSAGRIPAHLSLAAAKSAPNGVHPALSRAASEHLRRTPSMPTSAAATTQTPANKGERATAGPQKAGANGSAAGGSQAWGLLATGLASAPVAQSRVARRRLLGEGEAVSELAPWQQQGLAGEGKVHGQEWQGHASTVPILSEQALLQETARALRQGAQPTNLQTTRAQQHQRYQGSPLDPRAQHRLTAAAAPRAGAYAVPYCSEKSDDDSSVGTLEHSVELPSQPGIQTLTWSDIHGHKGTDPAPQSPSAEHGPSPPPDGCGEGEGIQEEDEPDSHELLMQDHPDSAQEEGLEQRQGQEQEMRWHEVQALPMRDPVTGKEALLLVQADITERHVMTHRMATLTETQLTMLEALFPRQVLEYAVGAGSSAPAGTLGSLAFQHDDITVLFLDIVGFTSMSKEVQPAEVMHYLNSLYNRLDDLCEEFDLYKVDTAGDCYIVAGALMTVDEDGFMAFDWDASPRQGARSVVDFAQAALHTARTVPMPNAQPTCIRVGIHTGPVVSGLLGTKLLKFSLFGDTMNTSSRMETTCKPGCVHMSDATYGFLDDDQRRLFQATGGVEVKGKGLMATFVHEPDDEWVPLADDLNIIPEASETEEQLQDPTTTDTVLSDRQQGQPEQREQLGQRGQQERPQLLEHAGSLTLPISFPPVPRSRYAGTLLRSLGSNSGAPASSESTSIGSVGLGTSMTQVTLDTVERQMGTSQPLQLQLHSSPVQNVATAGSSGQVGGQPSKRRRASLSELPAISSGFMRWRLQLSVNTQGSAPRLARGRRAGSFPRQGIADVFRAAAAVIEQQEQLSTSPTRSSIIATMLRQLAPAGKGNLNG